MCQRSSKMFLTWLSRKSRIFHMEIVKIPYELARSLSKAVARQFLQLSKHCDLRWLLLFPFRKITSLLFSKLVGQIPPEMSEISGSEGSLTSELNSELDYASWGSSSESTPIKRVLSFQPRSEAYVDLGRVHFTWCSEYAKDILAYLHELETKRKRIMFKSPQKHLRFNLVELIKSAAESLRLNRTTVHLAVYLLDVFMDSFKIIPNKLSLVAMTCVLVAAKMEERDRNIPKMMRLNSLVNSQYTKSEFRIVELKLLSTLNWSLLYPTPATFIECYASKVISLEDYNNLIATGSLTPPRQRFTSYNHLFSTANSLIFEFLDYTLQEPRIMHLEPSALAAACLAAARKLCCLVPLWPKSLRTLTGYEIEALTEFIETLISFRESQLPKRKDTTPDSGFLSYSSSDSEEEQQSILPVPFKRRKLEG